MKASALLLFSVGMVACKPSPTPPKTVAAAATAQPASDFAHTPDRPGYTVSISYSPKSLAELTRRRETVIVASYLSGWPKADAPKNLISDIGDINLGTNTTEVPSGQPARIPAVHFDAATLTQTDGRDPELLINVYSGRKSSPDNLLSCSISQGPLAAVENTTIPITCKLIAE